MEKLKLQSNLLDSLSEVNNKFSMFSIKVSENALDKFSKLKIVKEGLIEMKF